MKHCPVTDAVPDSWVRSIQNRLLFLGREVPDKSGIRLFRGDCQNALDLLQRRRHTIFHVAHERLDGCEPDVSGSGVIATSCFKMVEEDDYQRCIKLLQ